MIRKKQHGKVWFMCLNPYADKPPTVRHKSYYAAAMEALRMAQTTGQKCHVLEVRGTAHPSVATWHPREVR
jgi:hypothetical protein